MSTTEPSSDTPLDFERAEFARPAESSGPACAYCKKGVGAEYWQVAKRVACMGCRNQIAAHVAQSESRKSFLQAMQYGVAAAAAGWVVWIVVARVTGCEPGFLAIGIGSFGGKSGRKGSRGIGGPRYQAPAMFLPYSAIPLASLPAIPAPLSKEHQDAPPAPHPV